MPARVLLVLLFLLAGCSSYVAPDTVAVDPAAFDESCLISYRTLVRADFKASRAPRAMEARSVGAVTAALLRTSCCSIATFRRDSVFVAVVENLRFEARLSQNHSWWNPAQTRDALLLEHEQTHFAFSELCAREANAHLDQIRMRIRSVARTEREAVCLARTRLQSEVDRLQSAVAARDAEFDRDTLNGRRADRSHEWFVHIQRELGRSALIASLPASPWYQATTQR